MFNTPYIGGKSITVPDTALGDVVNPATQIPFSKIFMASAEHMRQAIDAAHVAKEGWGRMLPATRDSILRQAADVMESARDEIAGLLIDEAGSTFGKAQFEVSFTVDMLNSVAGEARRLHGEIISADVLC